jgi:hypothetical protein
MLNHRIPADRNPVHTNKGILGCSANESGRACIGQQQGNILTLFFVFSVYPRDAVITKKETRVLSDVSSVCNVPQSLLSCPPTYNI